MMREKKSEIKKEKEPIRLHEIFPKKKETMINQSFSH